MQLLCSWSCTCGGYVQYTLRALTNLCIAVQDLRNPLPDVEASLAYCSKIFPRRYTSITVLEIQVSKQQKVMELNSWCWLQTINKIQYDCSIGVFDCSTTASISITAIK